MGRKVWLILIVVLALILALAVTVVIWTGAANRDDVTLEPETSNGEETQGAVAEQTGEAQQPEEEQQPEGTEGTQGNDQIAEPTGEEQAQQPTQNQGQSSQTQQPTQGQEQEQESVGNTLATRPPDYVSPTTTPTEPSETQYSPPAVEDIPDPSIPDMTPLG